MKVVIIGGGVAGTAAAWAAHRAGADVSVIFDRGGASALYSGALDAELWDGSPGPVADERDLQLFSTALDAWSFGPGPCRLATFDGVLRTARAHDAALLDLSLLAGRTVSVADTPLEHLDAASLAWSLSASAWARDTRTRFEAVKVPGLVTDAERRAPCYDVALRADEPGGAERIAAALSAAHPNADAWLLGPWLGTRPGAAERVRAIVTVPCGETTSPVGGPAGARFDASRDALFASAGIGAVRGRVSRVERAGAGFRITGAGPTFTELSADVAVLATGGVCAEGLVVGSVNGSSTFRVSLDAPVTVALDGRASLQASPLSAAISRMENPGALVRLGILADGALARGGQGLLVAGDCAFGRPRTALEAARAGIATMRTIRSS